MESLPENLPLAELKKKIKEFKTTQTPKLSSKKSVLSEYATRVGILKSKGGEPTTPPPPKEVLQESLVKAAKPSKPLKSVKVEELPKELKKPSKKLKEPEPPKKKGSPFSQFMSAHKGQGYSMAQLAEMYRGQK
jgi:hypothetical protein